ncbi:hypothetical protein SAMN04488494_0597 [Xylanibacter ruminicola]|uniref:Uncharacterized protein n=1 Tax=Xylanibacter ruminicola TaxID=839 RepID=A0A1M7D1F0_XYLRU|nr:hypothetical protein [Xylanibacter ruminicola]SHL73341.1 hypothetical protein SAMN04488494_0597 [Xylanibacter ruminicola]
MTNDNLNTFEYPKSQERLNEEAYLDRCREYWRKEKEKDKEIETLRSKLGIKETIKNTPAKLFDILFKIAYWCIIACVLVALMWLFTDGFPLLVLGVLWVGALLLKCWK